MIACQLQLHMSILPQPCMVHNPIHTGLLSYSYTSKKILRINKPCEFFNYKTITDYITYHTQNFEAILHYN